MLYRDEAGAQEVSFSYDSNSSTVQQAEKETIFKCFTQIRSGSQMNTGNDFEEKKCHEAMLEEHIDRE